MTCARVHALVVQVRRLSSPVQRHLGDDLRLAQSDLAKQRINDSEAYSRDGAHTNHAESFFSRLRRMIGGQHHKVGAQHLGAYAVQTTWLEDGRDQSNGAPADRLISRALAAPANREWKGDRQRRAA
jgi:hypothetical protein